MERAVKSKVEKKWRGTKGMDIKGKNRNTQVFGLYRGMYQVRDGK